VIRQRILSLLQNQIDVGLHPGARLYVSRDSEPLLDLCVGHASHDVPMTHDTPMLWMSAGKPVTAVALLQQVERGRVELDEKVAYYLPGFGTGGKEAITIRHLLTHTGGFRLGDKVDVTDWNQAIQEIANIPIEPHWKPGEKAGYHISGSWLVLGEVVRQVTGCSIRDYLQQEVFRASGMKHCSLGLEDSQSNASLMHLTEHGKTVPHPLLGKPQRLRQWRTGSNILGSAQALGLFYETMLRGGGNLLRPETVRLMTERHRKGLFDQTFQHVIDFGLGFIINSSEYGPETVPYGFGRHASAESFGHGGNQSSIAFADPRHGLVLVYITNGMPGEAKHQKRMRDVMEAVYEELVLR
jgi:CubicO group peptidase (beta-lactamase class C family)